MKNILIIFCLLFTVNPSFAQGKFAANQEEMVRECYGYSDASTSTMDQYFKNSGLMDPFCSNLFNGAFNTLKDVNIKNIKENLDIKPPLVPTLLDKISDILITNKAKSYDLIQKQIKKVFGNNGDIEIILGPKIGLGTLNDTFTYVQGAKINKKSIIATAVQVDTIGQCLSNKFREQFYNNDVWGLPTVHHRFPVSYGGVYQVMILQQNYINQLRNYLFNLNRLITPNKEDLIRLQNYIDHLAFSTFVGVDAPGVNICDKNSGEYFLWVNYHQKTDALVKMSGGDIAMGSRTCSQEFIDKKSSRGQIIDKIASNDELRKLEIDHSRSNPQGTIPLPDTLSVEVVKNYLLKSFTLWVSHRYLSPEGTILFKEDWTHPSPPCLTLFNGTEGECIKNNASAPLTPDYIVKEAFSRLINAIDVYTVLALHSVKEELSTGAYRRRVPSSIACNNILTEYKSISELSLLREGAIHNVFKYSVTLANKIENNINSRVRSDLLEQDLMTKKFFDFAKRVRDTAIIQDSDRVKDALRNSRDR